MYNKKDIYSAAKETDILIMVSGPFNMYLFPY